MLWGIAINGEMKLLEEMIHRIDVISSAAPFLILKSWFQTGASRNESFEQSTKDIYRVIEASHRTHLQLQGGISEQLNKWDEGFFRKLSKSDKDLKILIDYNRDKYAETSNKLLGIYQKIEKDYIKPTLSHRFPEKHSEMSGSKISNYDILQHNILSTIVSIIINSGEPYKAMNYLARLNEPLQYQSTSELAQKLNERLEAAGCAMIDGANLHLRIICSYHMITQAVLTNNVEIIIETMQELLGWLTGSGFHTVFQISKNINHIEFQSFYKTFYPGKPLLSECFVDEALYKLEKLLPGERVLVKNEQDLSRYSLAIGRALSDFFIEIENAANNVVYKCPQCNETAKRILNIEPLKTLTKNKSLMYKASELYGEWVSNEIKKKSNTVLGELKNIGILDLK